MNLVAIYMTQIIWNHVKSIEVEPRKNRVLEDKLFMEKLGAPEVISNHKKYAVILKFHKHLNFKTIEELLQLQYDKIHFYLMFKDNYYEVTIIDASVTWKQMQGEYPIVELTAADVDIKHLR